MAGTHYNGAYDTHMNKAWWIKLVILSCIVVFSCGIRFCFDFC